MARPAADSRRPTPPKRRVWHLAERQAGRARMQSSRVHDRAPHTAPMQQQICARPAAPIACSRCKVGRLHTQTLQNLPPSLSVCASCVHGQAVTRGRTAHALCSCFPLGLLINAERCGGKPSTRMQEAVRVLAGGSVRSCVRVSVKRSSSTPRWPSAKVQSPHHSASRQGCRARSSTTICQGGKTMPVSAARPLPSRAAHKMVSCLSHDTTHGPPAVCSNYPSPLQQL